MSFLIEQGREDIWCEPRQDSYHVFKPWRVSSPLGSVGRVVIEWYQVNLPTPIDDIYHLYHIGKIDDARIGIELGRGEWLKVSDIMVTNKALIDVYLTNGTMLPRDECYLMMLKDYSVVLAVKIKRYDLGTYRYVDEYTGQLSEVPYRVNSEDLYIRFYRNMRFSTAAWQQIAGDSLFPIRHIVRQISTLPEYTTFIGEIANINNRFNGSGAGLFFKDGFVETQPTAYTLDIVGKTLSYTYDDSIKSIQFHKLNGLKSFQSTLDVGKSKYIILSTLDYETIDYLDDVDFYVVNRNPSTGRYRGVMLNRYIKDSIRMITHNAWSLNADYITALLNYHDWSAQLDRIEIMVVVRQGGLIRGLVHQNNRIEELYRLPRAKVLNVLAGDTAAPAEWHASSLENSAYSRLMSVRIDEITDRLSMDAFGYNGISSLAEPVFYDVSDLDINRHIPVENALRIKNPQGTGDRAVFCYNDQRELIHYYTNDSLDVVELLPTPAGDDADVVEIFHARIDELEDGTTYDADIESVDLPYWGFRCYVCPIVNGIPNEKWVDVTGTPYYVYSETDGIGKIAWNWGLLDSAKLFPAVRRNGVIHIHKPTMPTSDSAYDGVLKFTVGSSPLWFGNRYLRPMSLAPAICTVFMDGKILIRGIDYQVQWPMIIIAKRPAGDIADTEVIIRTYGCCDAKTMAPFSTREVGFVKGGVLSVDSTFDVRNDRNVMVNIGGHLYHRSEVRFSESEDGVDVTDGLPYIVEDYVTPIEPYTGFDTVVERTKSFDIDERVKDYLTTQLVGDDLYNHTVVFERWRIFSPFMNAIIHEMLHGSVFNDNVLGFRYGNVEVDLWVAPYLYLLDFDPACLELDMRYVVIYPHLYLDPVEVTNLQFTFLQYLVRNYLKNNVILSQSVNIGN